MFQNSDELLKYVKDEGIEMVDVRFVDLPGIEQHFTVPVSSFDQDVFDNGLAFDGSLTTLKRAGSGSGTFASTSLIFFSIAVRASPLRPRICERSFFISSWTCSFCFFHAACSSWLASGMSSSCVAAKKDCIR